MACISPLFHGPRFYIKNVFESSIYPTLRKRILARATKLSRCTMHLRLIRTDTKAKYVGNAYNMQLETDKNVVSQHELLNTKGQDARKTNKINLKGKIYTEQDQSRMEQYAAPTFQGLKREQSILDFGAVRIIHGNVFDVEADLLMVPMTPNFNPQKGLGII